MPLTIAFQKRLFYLDLEPYSLKSPSIPLYERGKKGFPSFNDEGIPQQPPFVKGVRGDFP
jgi:hypothetical protein